MGQLPKERVTPDAVFNNVGLDYAGPVYLKQGSVRKPVIVKAYVCVFVSLSTKAVHIEAVSDLTSQAFLACLEEENQLYCGATMVRTSLVQNVSSRSYTSS